MLRTLTNFVSRLLLGSAASAARQRLDHDARLAMTPRTLETELYAQFREEGEYQEPRRIGAFLVYEGWPQQALARFERAVRPSRCAPIGSTHGLERLKS